MLVLTLLAALAAQDSRPPQWVKYDIARERIAHKVVVDAELRNAGAAELSGAKVTAIYFDGDRELRRSPTVPVPRAAPGATVNFKIEAEQVPNFTRYDLYVETSAATYLYLGTDAVSLPALRPSSGPKLALVSHTVSPLTLVVRNGGGAAADEPTAAITFKNGAAALGQVRVRLEKLVGPASEETFEIAVPGAPAHTAVDVTLAWQAADEIVMSDTVGGARDVTLRQCRAVRLTDGSARVSGVVANGTSGAVGKVAARFQLGRLEAPYEFPGTLKSGESRPFVFYIPDGGTFEAISFSLGYDSAASPAVAAGPPPAPGARRTGSKPVEADRIKLPPPPVKVKDAGGLPEVRPPSVGVRGLLVVSGTVGKNNKYSGDHYLMRMIFLDEKGKPWQPEGTVSFSLYEGDKNLKKAQRTITRGSYGVDSSRISSETIDLESMAFDKKSGELWVCIYWSDESWKKPRADLTVEIPGTGTYTLKGIEGRWDFTPRWPDGK